MLSYPYRNYCFESFWYSSTAKCHHYVPFPNSHYLPLFHRNLGRSNLFASDSLWFGFCFVIAKCLEILLLLIKIHTSRKVGSSFLFHINFSNTKIKIPYIYPQCSGWFFRKKFFIKSAGTKPRASFIISELSTTEFLLFPKLNKAKWGNFHDLSNFLGRSHHEDN